MPDETGERRDNPGLRVQELLRRTGTVDPWDFSRVMDEAVVHAGTASRADALASSRPWRPLGPRNLGGRIRSLAQDERNPRVVYAGSGHGGLWKTTDAGDSWQVLDDFRPPNARQAVPIGAVAVSYSNPEIIYAGTGEPTRDTPGGGTSDIRGIGLFWSRNGGAHFEQLDPPDPGAGALGAGQYETIIVDPWEPRRLWIASPDRGLARGTPPSSGSVPVFQRDDVDDGGAPAAGTQQASDIVVDFGPRRSSPPATVTVYAALWGNGVYRAVYDRNNERYQTVSGVTWTPITPVFPAGFTRIKLAICRQQPRWIVAVAGLPGDTASNVFISGNRGTSWVDTGARALDTGDQANYDLVLGLHPSDPSIIVTGSVDLFLGRYTHGAPPPNTNWIRILDSNQYDVGDRAQHADQHALLFDAVNPRRIWVGNDGGLSSSPDLGGRWRERHLGINAAQFYDISTHPQYPYIYAGGLQDNGTWLSYGGQSWYEVNGGDGGEVAFDPVNPRRFISTWQEGLDRSTIQSTTNAIGSTDFMNRMPDVPRHANQDINHRTQLTPATGFPLAPPPPNPPPFVHPAPFVGVVAHHPTRAGHAIAGRQGSAYLTLNALAFNQMANLPAFNTANDVVTKVVYSTQNPDTHWWITTDQGEVFFTNDADATAWASVAPPGIAGANITGIAINRRNDNIAAISVTLRTAAPDGSQGRIFITGDAGQNWSEISGRTAPNNSNAANRFNPSPATALVFDPSSSGVVTDAQTIYCACLAGVYVIRNAMAPTAPGTSFTPQWRTFNGGLPLTLIFDLEAVRFTDNNGQAQQLIRCATYARGAYECDLSGAAAVRLLIRDNIVDDGLRYAAAHAVPNNRDPRRNSVPAAALVLNRSIDIRIDTPPYRFLGQVVDGLELDDRLRSDNLAAGETNVIYVQVNNVGAGSTTTAKLHLYWAQASAAPVTTPDLQAAFWGEFPDVAAEDTWEKVGSRDIALLASGQPKVVAFQWDVPSHLTGNVSLLAVCTDSANDAINGAALGNVVEPTSAGSFIGIERRTALYVTPVTPAPPDALLRDGFDDQGRLGETAWGARSHDMAVVHAVPANINTEFADANNRRLGDVLDGSETNHIYVRINNRGGQPLNNPRVEVFHIPLATAHDPNSWVSLGSSTLPNVAARSAAIAPVITWPAPGPPDPAPHKVHLLAALIQADNEPRPDFISRIDSIKSFWKLFLEEIDSGNAVLRGLRWQA